MKSQTFEEKIDEIHQATFGEQSEFEKLYNYIMAYLPCHFLATEDFFDFCKRESLSHLSHNTSIKYLLYKAYIEPNKS